MVIKYKSNNTEIDYVLVTLGILTVSGFALFLPSLCPLFAILECFMCCCHCPLSALILPSLASVVLNAKEEKMRA